MYGSRSHSYSLPRLLLLVSALVAFLFLRLCLLPFHQRHSSSQEITSWARNRTLGFGAIYVLTEDVTTWRVEGLRQAAKLTGLQLTVPVQEHPSDDEINAYLAADEVIGVADEIRAVLNYISLIETFLSSGHETALFVEDDVDFSIHIGSQMEALSEAILAYTGPSNDEEPTYEDLVDQIASAQYYPYGQNAWDVLWLGHWGLEYTSEVQIWPYRDPHALPWSHLYTSFNSLYTDEAQLQPDEQFQQQRIVHSAAPLATYAFALTRDAALQIIQNLKEDRIQAFDYGVHRLCKGLKLLCAAPVPELFHHHKVVGQKSLLYAGEQDTGKHDIKWYRNRHKYTYNIEWSARCNAAGVGEKIGVKWQCMPGKYDVLV